MFTSRALMVLLYFGLSPAMLIAEENFFSEIDVELEPKQDDDSIFDYKGFVRQKVKYGVREPDADFWFERDRQGVAQFQTDIYGELSGGIGSNMLWRLGGKFEVDWIEWSEGRLDWEPNHEAFFLKDAFVDVTFNHDFWLRVGNQLFAWGESEGLAITDVLSPRDLREPGQVELRDTREQIPAILLSFPIKNIKISTVLTYKAGHNNIADKKEEFYPFLTAKLHRLTVSRHNPANQWESAARVDYQFNGGDLSVVVADINDNQLMFGGISEGQGFSLEQKRVSMFGISFNKVKENWLLKAEIGKYWNQPVVGSAVNPVIQQDQWRSMVGVEYRGKHGWLFSFEVNNIYTDDVYKEYASGFESERSESGGIFRIQKTNFNERLKNRWWLIDVPGDQGKICRWDLVLDWTDSVEFGVSMVVYDTEKENSLLYPYRNHDSINFSVTYYF